MAKRRLSVPLDDSLAEAVEGFSELSGESQGQFARRMIKEGVGINHLRQTGEIIGRDPETGKETLIADKDGVMQYRPIPRS
jgi:hypothetical protein